MISSRTVIFTLWKYKKKYGIRIRPRSSLSHHRGWIDGAMTRLCADDDAMVRQCDGDGAMVHVRYGDEAMLYISHHRIKSSDHRHYRLFCSCAVWIKWRQDYIVVFSCYDLSITNQKSCMLVLNALYFNQCLLDFKINATRTES